MRLQVLEVEAIEQPAQLRLVEFDDRAFEMKRPLEAFLLKTLQPKAETGALPVKHLDLIATLVDEAEQVAAERIIPERCFNQNRQTVDTFSEVHRIAA